MNHRYSDKIKKMAYMVFLLLFCLSGCSQQAQTTTASEVSQKTTLPVYGIQTDGTMPESTAGTSETLDATQISTGISAETSETAAVEASSETSVRQESTAAENTESLEQTAEPEETMLSEESTESDTRKEAEICRIFCYGDSNTYGYTPECTRLEEQYRWPYILGQLLGEDYSVEDDGLVGRTTAYDRPGAAYKNGLTAFADIFAAHKPVDILVVMLGTNDCLAEMKLSAEQIAAGMDLLLSEAEKQALEQQGYVPQIILVSPSKILPDYVGTNSEGELNSESPAKSQALGILYRNVAARHQTQYLDGTTLLETDPRDCEHLTIASHQKLAELLADMVRTMDRES